MNLSLDGKGEEGINIDRTTTLTEVRVSFPVPPEYAFGVPEKRERDLLVSDFLPLVLLKVDECRVGTLRSRPVAELPQVRCRLECARPSPLP